MSGYEGFSLPLQIIHVKIKFNRRSKKLLTIYKNIVDNFKNTLYNRIISKTIRAIHNVKTYRKKII
jgi:hypothetical protein